MIYRAAVLTVSDTAARGERVDESGDLAAELLLDVGLHSVERGLVPDELEKIIDQLNSYVLDGLALVLTTGGTGLGPRDVTPEATRKVIEREAPGIAECLRSTGLRHTPLASLSRGVAGTAGGTLIVNLPGSPKAVGESMEALLPVLPHALSLLAGEEPHS